jgi:hypothetical protein
MEGDAKEVCAAVFFIVIVLLAVWGATCIICGIRGFSVPGFIGREDCVKRGVAEYNQKTGDWQWKAEFAEESK